MWIRKPWGNMYDSAVEEQEVTPTARMDSQSVAPPAARVPTWRAGSTGAEAGPWAALLRAPALPTQLPSASCWSVRYGKGTGFTFRFENYDSPTLSQGQPYLSDEKRERKSRTPQDQEAGT